MTDRLKVLDKAIEKIAAPVLEPDGFRYGAKRTFRKVGATTCRIINFQVGTRWMAGKFTVNLGVYCPEFFLYDGKPPPLQEACEWNCLPGFRERLGKLAKSPWTRLWTGFLGPSEDAWWKEILYGSHDRWWRFSADEEQTNTSVRKALALIKTVGFPWLDDRDRLEAMKGHYLEIARRK